MLSTILIVAGVAAASPIDKRQSPVPENVPAFVTQFAPVVHLFSGENYKPADIGAQVANTKPFINNTAVASGYPDPLTLDNLDQLNNIEGSNGGKDIYLTSNSDITTDPRPQFLYGVTPDSTGKTEGAVSCAIITADKGNSTIDAFYLYFYAFDDGGYYIDDLINVGNHVGDWEHNAIRFVNGAPTEIWYSQHSGGQAFSYEATEKYLSTGRPVTYSANGTHANYATPGTHDHTIPGISLPAGPVEDHTDAGTVWDPTLSAYYYSFDVASGKFAAYGDAPVNWLYYLGRWGDDKIPESDKRQECIFGIDALCKYVGGPTGPEDKDLARKNICPDSQKSCDILPLLLPRGMEE